MRSPLLLVFLVLTGCVGRPLGIVQEVPDAGPVGCAGPEDCLLAQPFDCCNGCPRVMSRAELAVEPCYYDPALPPPSPVPLECQMDCFACPPCFPQPLDSTCEAGQCVALHEGCPNTGDPPVGDVAAHEVSANREALLGKVYRVSGVVLPAPPSCDDVCPAADCCSSTLTLDGYVHLTGRPCGLDLAVLSDDYLADTFHGNAWGDAILEVGGAYELVGRLGAFANYPFEPTLEVQGITRIDPEGAGGRYALTVTYVEEQTANPGCVTGPEYPWKPGDAARLYVAETDGFVAAVAPYFVGASPRYLLFGDTFSPDGTLVAASPIECRDCACGYSLGATVEDGTIEGRYHQNDCECRFEVRFTGLRE